MAGVGLTLMICRSRICLNALLKDLCDPVIVNPATARVLYLSFGRRFWSRFCSIPRQTCMDSNILRPHELWIWNTTTVNPLNSTRIFTSIAPRRIFSHETFPLDSISINCKPSRSHKILTSSRSFLCPPHSHRVLVPPLSLYRLPNQTRGCRYKSLFQR